MNLKNRRPLVARLGVGAVVATVALTAAACSSGSLEPDHHQRGVDRRHVLARRSRCVSAT